MAPTQFLRQSVEHLVDLLGRFPGGLREGSSPGDTHQVLPPREVYAHWAGTYEAQAHNPLMQAEERAMLDAIGDVRGLAVLDIGTGPGRYRRRLEGGGAARVVGLDQSWAMLTSIQRPQAHEGQSQHRWPRLVCADACALPLAAATCDLAVAGLMVGDVEPLDQWASELWRVLRANGRLVYSDFHEGWASRGWQRTFESLDGARYVLPYVSRSTDTHVSALTHAGFTSIDVGVVRLGAAPVCSVFTARKPACGTPAPHGHPDLEAPS